MDKMSPEALQAFMAAVLAQIAEIQQLGSAVVATGAVFASLTSVMVITRMASRPIFNIALGIEDWLLLGALLLFWGETGAFFYAIERGQKAATDTSGLVDFYKFTYVAGCFYYPIVYLINMSILFLYRRLFSTQEFKKITLYLMISQTVWVIPSTIVEVFPCTPIQYFWLQPTIEGFCINYPPFWMVNSVFELITDIILIILPLWQISRLQLNWQKKLAVSILFVIGGLSIITQIIRMAKTWIPGSTQLDWLQDAIWLNCHIGTGIICACLPTFRPLLSKGSSMVSSMRSKYSSSGKSTGNSNGSSNPSKNINSFNSDRYRQIGKSSDKQPMVSSTASAWMDEHNDYHGHPPAGAIEMKRTVEVV